MSTFPSLLAATTGSSGALVVFSIYMLAVFLMAVLSHRILAKKQFLGEYFLGSRSLGVWAFALTFAATSASGGSFMGFPAIVYSHGWVVALWIGSYMIVPILVMGLMGKRINQIARKTGAITIPDLLRDRFDSAPLGGLATFLLVFFVTINLVGQFKAGSVILQALLHDSATYQRLVGRFAGVIREVPWLSSQEVAPGYLLCLITFGIGVIIYTTYGGFRAVVWTDVLQGIVMVGGVVIMLPLAIYFAGGLSQATDDMAAMTPPREVTLQLTLREAEIIERQNRVDSRGEKVQFILPPFAVAGSWLDIPATATRPRRLFRTQVGAMVEAPFDAPAVRFSSQESDDNRHDIPAIEITDAGQIASVEVSHVASIFDVAIVGDPKPYAFGAGERNMYVTGPGPSASSDVGFLPLSLAMSFFLMWTFSGAGQPGNMVRQMAFNGSKTLRYGILTLCFYFSLIYFPLVIIFCCARVILPGWEIEPDRIMPEMAKSLTSSIGAPWLAGLLVAAPFAAVMSTVDSFLLMSSSGVVRDIYQRNINPQASEKTIKRLTYITTLAIGSAAMIAAVNPPQYLQQVIIFTGSGLSTSFLVPVALSLYWPRFNRTGAFASMLAGFISYTSMYVIGFAQTSFTKMQALQPGNFHPFIIGAVVSLVTAIVVTLLTTPPDEKTTRRFFYADKSE